MDTSAKEMSSWYSDTGLYTSVNYSEERTLAKIKEISKTGNNHVALWIHSALLIPGEKSTHMITLESPLVIDEANDKVTFDYWTWGQRVENHEYLPNHI